MRTEELHNAEQSFKSQLLDLQKKIEEGSESQLKLQATDISSVNDQLEAVRLEARAAIEAGKRDSEIIVKKLTAQLNTNEESLAKRTQVLQIVHHCTVEIAPITALSTFLQLFQAGAPGGKRPCRSNTRSTEGEQLNTSYKLQRTDQGT